MDTYNLYKITLSTMLKKIRKEKKISQSTMAEKIDLSPVAYCNIENAKSWPKAETLSKISEVLEVPLYQLFMDPVHDRVLTISEYREAGENALKAFNNSINSTTNKKLSAPFELPEKDSGKKK